MKIKRNKYNHLKKNIKEHYIYIYNYEYFDKLINLFKNQYYVLLPDSFELIQEKIDIKNNTGVIVEVNYNKKFVSLKNPVTVEEYLKFEKPHNLLFSVTDFKQYITNV